MGIKRLIAMTLILTMTISYPCYAQYSEETLRLAREAGLEYDTPLEEVLRRQEERSQNKANNSTPTAENVRETNARPLKSSNDELRIYGGQQSVKVTDTSDELHVYSNTYGDTSGYGSKNSYDEFHTAPVDIEANDGYKHGNIDELHINENYRNQVWKPDHKIIRLSIDEFKLPNEL